MLRLWDITDCATRLRIESGPDGLELHWSLGVLQHAASLSSDWQDLTGIHSPLPLPRGSLQGFYRVRVPDP
jgi:hypothetical protein